ncbi:uncharacterized protein LOC119583774 isoform X2 [Penaeus monodon]|uniref:uncharacterized protein LOC119583774 isoform X2 n=1 Tax=Penaeus monodon TaxID=6687 RepID=UPI0018A6F4C9|nr:uncharacterized protein LOC119583774 isoform X2 [Penaeus monodon]
MLRRNARYFRMLVLAGAFFCVLTWARSIRQQPVTFEAPSREDRGAARVPSISQDASAEMKEGNETAEAELPPPVAEAGSSCHHTILASLDHFYEFIHRIDIKCTNLMQMAGPTDNTLLEGRRVCVDAEYFARDQCLVYLFGIKGDWSFAEEMERKLGCKVFVFDPTVDQDERNRSSSIASYRMSVSSDFGVSGDPPKDQLLRIMEMLGHEESIIDLLWVDMPAGEELLLLGDLFSSSQQIIGNFKQIGINIHPMNEGMTERIRKYWYYFQQLTCHGLRLVTRQPNIEYENLFKLNNRTRSRIYELLWAREI